MLKLIGIALVAAGFALRLNTLLVVLVAGLATGLVSGLSLHQTITYFGEYFVQNRYMSLAIVLALPVVGLLERYGLRERAEFLIRRQARATAGRVILLYQAVREVTIALGIPIGGHAQMVRPLVAPMAEGAAATEHGALNPTQTAAIRAQAAAAENVGNFFAEDVFIGVGAILLMKGFFDSVGLDVSVWDMALWGLPTALLAMAVGWWRCRALDRRLLALRGPQTTEVAR
ncbi:MAG: DUF969 domain-containing protein [Verrucomicrobia bacterium]|nr:DUF969 domain-containing protein [Verrucomicrobiota bacterium]